MEETQRLEVVPWSYRRTRRAKAELAPRRTAAARRSGRYIRRTVRREECIEFIGAFAPGVIAGPMLEFGSWRQRRRRGTGGARRRDASAAAGAWGCPVHSGLEVLALHGYSEDTRRQGRLGGDADVKRGVKEEEKKSVFIELVTTCMRESKPPFASM